jgi:TPR repeat protein
MAGLGIPRDLTQAVRWYASAADQGEPLAQNDLGMLYKLGGGVPKNPSMALDLFKKAAAQCEAEAQFNIGLLYLIGVDGPADYVKAYAWFEVAAKSSNDETRRQAEGKVAFVALKLDSQQIAEAQRVAQANMPSCSAQTQ